MPAPIGHTCPDIDKVIKMVREIQFLAKEGMKESEIHSDHYQRYKDIEWDIDDIIGRMEDLRNSNSRLRDWGEGLEEELNEAREETEETV